MNNFSLQSLYYKSIIKSNFTNINTSWLISKNSSFDKVLIYFQFSSKKYNKKMFSILVMLMEFITRGYLLSKKKIRYFSINKKNTFKINVNYIIKLNKMFILFDNFINDFYWLDYETLQLPIKNKIALSISKQKPIEFSLTKILDLTTVLKNKIQFEKYFLKKKYKWTLHFSSSNQLYYLWWLKSIGFNNFKKEINL